MPDQRMDEQMNNMCGSRRGGAGGPDPLKIIKNIGFLSHTGVDLLKMTKLPSQHSMLGNHWHVSETFRWRAEGYPLIVFLDPLIQKKNVAKLDHQWQNFLDPRMNKLKQ